MVGAALSSSDWFADIDGDDAITITIDGKIALDALVFDDGTSASTAAANKGSAWPASGDTITCGLASGTTTSCDIYIAVKLAEPVPSEAGSLSLDFTCPTKPSGYACSSTTNGNTKGISFTAGDQTGTASLRITYPGIAQRDGNGEVKIHGTWS